MTGGNGRGGVGDSSGDDYGRGVREVMVAGCSGVGEGVWYQKERW